MANAIYPKYKEAIIQSASNSSLTGTVKVAMVDTGTYTYSDSHQYASSLSGVVGTPATLSGKSYTNGVFDAADVTYSSVTGDSVEALVIYIDTGTASTSRLVAYLDTGWTGLPVTPNGGDITLQFDAAGIFAL